MESIEYGMNKRTGKKLNETKLEETNEARINEYNNMKRKMLFKKPEQHISRSLKRGRSPNT